MTGQIVNTDVCKCEFPEPYDNNPRRCAKCTSEITIAGNVDNYHDWRLRWLNIRRASLKQQADALANQRRAILAEVGEIEKELNDDLRGASKQ